MTATVPLEDKLYTSTQVSEILGVSLRTLYRYMEDGKIGSMRTASGRHRFTKDQILDFLNANNMGTQGGFQNTSQNNPYVNRNVPQGGQYGQQGYGYQQSVQQAPQQNVYPAQVGSASPYYDFNRPQGGQMSPNSPYGQQGQSQMGQFTQSSPDDFGTMRSPYDQQKKVGSTQSQVDTYGSDGFAMPSTPKKDPNSDIYFQDNKTIIDDDALPYVDYSKPLSSGQGNQFGQTADSWNEPFIQPKDQSTTSQSQPSKKEFDFEDDFDSFDDVPGVEYKKPDSGKDFEFDAYPQKVVYSEEPRITQSSDPFTTNVDSTKEKVPNSPYGAPVKPAYNQYGDFGGQSSQVQSNVQSPVSTKPENPYESADLSVDMNIRYYKSDYQDLIELARKIKDTAISRDMEYGFTLYAGLSLHFLIKPFTILHFYANPEDMQIWKDELRLVPSQKKEDANVGVIVNTDIVFVPTREIGGFRVVQDKVLMRDLSNHHEDDLFKKFRQYLTSN